MKRNMGPTSVDDLVFESDWAVWKRRETVSSSSKDTNLLKLSLNGPKKVSVFLDHLLEITLGFLPLIKVLFIR